MIKKWTVLALIAFMLITFSACTDGAEEVPTDSVAVVNGVPITMAEYNGTLQQQISMFEQYGMEFESEEGAELLTEIEAYVLEELITQKLILTHAIEEGYQAEDSEVEEQLEELRSQFSDEEYEQILEENDLTEDLLINDIRNNIIVQQYMESLDTGFQSRPVTDEELQESYALYEESEEEPLPFDEIKSTLEQQLLEQQEQQHYQAFMQELIEGLREEAEIEILI